MLRLSFFFRSVFYPSGMFSCFSLPPSSSSPEDGFLSFSEKREKRKTAFHAGSPFSVFLLGKLSFSSLLRNASFCRPLRREKEKKEIAMLSESVVRREESPSFLLFPPEGRSRHFSQKRKRKKRRSIGIRHHGGRRFLSMEERKKKKAKERNPPVCRAPVLGKRAKRKGGYIPHLFFRLLFSLPQKERKGKATVLMNFPSFKKKKKKKQKEKRRESPFFGAVLPFCRKRGTPPDAESGREEKGNLLQRTGENLLLPFFPKKEKKKREAPSFSCCPSFFVCSLFCTLLKEGKRHQIDMQGAAKDARMRKRKKEGRRLQRGRDRNRGCTSPISGGTTAIRRNSNTSPDTGTIRGRTGTS